MRTTYNGGVEGTYTSLPFGDAQTTAGTDTDPYHYAQLDSDYESGTDHAQFRQYSDAQGRWLSPDPYSGSYDAFNPQSFNRYVYVGNNPLSATDPSGLYRAAPCMGGSQCNNRDSSNPLDPSPTSLWSGAITGTILTVDLDNLVYSPAHWAPDTSQPDVPGASVWVPGAWVDETDTSDFSWYLNSPVSTAPFELAQNNAPNNGECDNACQLAHALGKTGVYQLTKPTFYACSAGIVGGAAVAVTPPAWFGAGLVAGISVATQKAVDTTNKWIGAKPGDTFYQYGPRDFAQAFGHTCLGTTGSSTTP